MNLLNLPDWNIEHVEDSARDYRVHATYIPEPGHCPTCGLFARLYHHGTREQLLMDLPAHGSGGVRPRWVAAAEEGGGRQRGRSEERTMRAMPSNPGTPAHSARPLDPQSQMPVGSFHSPIWAQRGPLPGNPAVVRPAETLEGPAAVPPPAETPGRFA